MNDKPHLDDDALAELQEVMEGEFDVLIRTYLSDSSERLNALRSALSDRDADAFTRSAHSFKGSCINIGAPRLGALCADAELAGKEERIDDARHVLDDMQSEFAIVRELLEHTLMR
ncbi:Hpt domain-containing protein [Marinobacter halodurans]|uniref:Hpt domain-containing protein n=1 Tax=Marinobacter halodurans TaxID=2528979 RepID=A0ABY1ZR04_9GAMM|nr:MULTISPECIES: Hpt domain-containing protein [Marinobacter]TBW59441.1 Hpt domain-containing protein [Marinobacter halodurans]